MGITDSNKVDSFDNETVQLVHNDTQYQAATETTASAINGKMNSLGQKNMAGSMPVTIANDQQVFTQSKTPVGANAPATASVGVTSAQILAAQASRKGLIIMNISTSVVSLGIGATAVLGSGITLLPGGTWNMDEYSFVVGAINAIASVAGSSIAIQEFV